MTFERSMMKEVQSSKHTVGSCLVSPAFGVSFSPQVNKTRLGNKCVSLFGFLDNTDFVLETQQRQTSQFQENEGTLQNF